MSYVYLDSRHNEFCLDDEAYAQVAALVKAHKLCMSDYRERHPYTPENPCVGKGICLEHLLRKQPKLTHLDIAWTTSDGFGVYYFIDEAGYVYTSTEDSSEEAKRDMLYTLSHHGFTPPEKVEARGKSVSFHSYYATLHGDLHTASVIVLSYTQHSEKVKGLFLLYKNGPTKAITRASDIYHRADELVEATKNTHGEYMLNGHSHFGKYESDTYEVISQLESAVHDVTLRFQNGKK